MKTSVWIVLASLAAGGCATLTPEERAARAAAEAESLKQSYGPTCDTLGYARDTDAWRNCLLTLASRDAYERARDTPAYIAPFYPYYPRYRVRHLPAPPPAPAPAPAPAPTPAP